MTHSISKPNINNGLNGSSSNSSFLLQRRVSKIDIDLSPINAAAAADPLNSKKDATKSSATPENIGVFLRFELKNGLLQYQNLVKATSKFKEALKVVSSARLEFAEALKGISNCRCSGAAGAVNAELEKDENPFKLSSEIYTALALKERDLVNLIAKDIEEPIKRNYDTHASKIQSHDKYYIDVIKKLNDGIRNLERKCSKMAKKSPELYAKYLTELNGKGTELERVKQAYVKAALEEERRNFSFLTQKSSLLVKSETQVMDDNAKLLSESCPKLVQIAFGIGENPLPNELLDLFGGMDPSKKVPEMALSIVAKGERQEDSTFINGEEEEEEDAIEEEEEEEENSIEIIAAEKENFPENPFSDQAETLYPAKEIINIEDEFESAQILRNQKVMKPPTAKAAMQEIASLSENLRNISFHAAKEAKLKKGLDSSASQDNDNGRVSNDQPPQPEYVQILHNFTARQDRELTVFKNEIVMLKKRDNNWIYVSRTGTGQTSQQISGWIPKAFAKEMSFPN